MLCSDTGPDVMSLPVRVSVSGCDWLVKLCKEMSSIFVFLLPSVFSSCSLTGSSSGRFISALVSSLICAFELTWGEWTRQKRSSGSFPPFSGRPVEIKRYVTHRSWIKTARMCKWYPSTMWTDLRVSPSHSRPQELSVFAGTVSTNWPSCMTRVISCSWYSNCCSSSTATAPPRLHQTNTHVTHSRHIETHRHTHRYPHLSELALAAEMILSITSFVSFSLSCSWANSKSAERERETGSVTRPIRQTSQM